MELAQRPPHPALASHVRNLAGWSEVENAPVRRRELPGGRIVLVVSLGPSMDVDGRTFTSFTGGLHDVPALTEHAGESRGVQAYLTPLGARRIFGLPMGELTGRVVELDDLIGRDDLAERLDDAPGWPARLALLERWIARRLMDAPPVPSQLEWAWRRLMETGGTVPVESLADELGWSRRHLAARFRREVGMAPKALARLLRFERAVERLRDGEDLAAIALGCGYYDQAHFNRDFRAFTGTTPTGYRQVTSVQDITSIAA
jgi:AraC-like DNA-binding protein